MIVEFFKRGRGKSSGPIGYFSWKKILTENMQNYYLGI